MWYAGSLQAHLSVSEYQQAGSPLFQRYKRCNWELEGKPEDDEDGHSRFMLSICYEVC